ncbi:hypothetical protein NXW13_00770 [Bacteroides thetaiotaomicron]|nr:hypothetical protein [Bacteroides thetaiotaomicron]
MVEAIQQAEIDQVEAKYDVLIQAEAAWGKILPLGEEKKEK